MSIDFINVADHEVKFNISNRGWRRIFCLARMYGWEPSGTVGDGESSSYFFNDGQLVRADDAMELGRAIELAIPDLTEEDPACAPDVLFGSFWEVEMVRRLEEAVHDGRRDPAHIFFSTYWTEKLTELVKFCKAGEFRIY
ncbi:MAG: hypothetical protein RBS09_01025 [Anaerolineaceae bacterium]|nr:hypothetical protein [Anaerolineaceae bacterium]